MTDPFAGSGETYASERAQLISLVEHLDAHAAAAKVPQSPEWSIKDVVAHVCGINADVVHQRLEGLGTDEWTAAQVDSRRDCSLADVIEEWVGYAPQIQALAEGDSFFAARVTGDLVAHVHDVAIALGVTADQESAGVWLGLERYAPYFCERAAQAGLEPVRVESGDRSWQHDDGEPAAVLRGSAFELFRAISGRRSESQIRAMDWTGDPEPYLAVVTPYGMPAEPVVE